MFVKGEMERIRAEQGEAELNKRAAEYLRKRREGAAQGGPAPEQGFGEKGPQNPDRAKRLSEMTPEEREAAMEKARDRAQRERRRGEPKPPPPIEDLRDPE